LAEEFIISKSVGHIVEEEGEQVEEEG